MQCRLRISPLPPPPLEGIEEVSQEGINPGSWVLILTDLQKSQELRSALNNGHQKEIMLQAIASSTTTYFDHLRRRWRDENDAKRLERRGVLSRQSKCDQRVRLVSQIISYIGIIISYLHPAQLHKRLINDATLEQVMRRQQFD